MDFPSRRHILRASAGALALTRFKAMGANDRINVAVVGLGGRGNSHMNEYAKMEGCRIVAVCDVDQSHLERGQALVNRLTGEKPKGYGDMREVFADKEVDAVSMPLPNHWHALSTIWACQAGKDVYIEKPASHDLNEGKKMLEAARKYKRVVQVGSQSRSMPHKIAAMEALHQGAIGKLYMAKGLCYKRRKTIGHKPDGPTPAGVDWDKFLGPAPLRAFNENRFLYNWHWFWDTGNGDIGNQGIHQMDVARWGMGLGLPKRVSSTGGKYVYDDDQETPNTQIATLDYGDAQIVFEVRGILTGAEGGMKVRGGNTIGNLFYGSDGWMAVDDAGYQIYKGEAQELAQDVKADNGKSETQPHMKNFLDVVRSRNINDLHADIDIGQKSAALVHLSNIAYRLNRVLDFDPATEKFTDAEANKLGNRPGRAPYSIPVQV